jgi:pyruvate dehydrogenase complex dehydrogenase (E1) component
VVAVLSSLARTGEASADEVTDAITRFGINPEAAEPFAL